MVFLTFFLKIPLLKKFSAFYILQNNGTILKRKTFLIRMRLCNIVVKGAYKPSTWFNGRANILPYKQSPTALKSTLWQTEVCACMCECETLLVTLLLPPLFWLLKKWFHPVWLTENRSLIQQLSLIRKEVQGNLEHAQLQA